MPLTYQYPKNVASRPDFEQMREHQTYGVCMALMGLAIDISKTDEKGEPDFEQVIEMKRRVKIWEGLHGSIFSDENRKSKTIEVLLRHWGITTNVSKSTPTQWDKRTREAWIKDQRWEAKA